MNSNDKDLGSWLLQLFSSLKSIVEVNYWYAIDKIIIILKKRRVNLIKNKMNSVTWKQVTTKIKLKANGYT